MSDDQEIECLKQICLALISHIIATQAVLCQLDKGAREKLKDALIANETEKFLKDKGKTLQDATAKELGQIVLRMPSQLNETLARLKRG